MEVYKDTVQQTKLPVSSKQTKVFSNLKDRFSSPSPSAVAESSSTTSSDTFLRSFNKKLNTKQQTRPTTAREEQQQQQQQQDKINPDIFKKIFNRNYTKITDTNQNSEETVTSPISPKRSSIPKYHKPAKAISPISSPSLLRSQIPPPRPPPPVMPQTLQLPILPPVRVKKQKAYEFSQDSLNPTTLTSTQTENSSLASITSTASSESILNHNNNPYIQHHQLSSSINNTKVSSLSSSKSNENLYRNVPRRKLPAKELDGKFKNELDLMLAEESQLPVLADFDHKRANYKVLSRDAVGTRKKQQEQEPIFDRYEMIKRHIDSDGDEDDEDACDMDSLSEDSLSPNLDAIVSNSSTSSERNDYLIDKYNITTQLISAISGDYDNISPASPPRVVDEKKENEFSDDAPSLSSTSTSLSSASSLSKDVSFSEQMALKLLHDIKKNMNCMEYEDLLQFLKDSIDKTCQHYDAATIINDGVITSWRYINSSVDKFKAKNPGNMKKQFANASAQTYSSDDEEEHCYRIVHEESPSPPFECDGEDNKDYADDVDNIFENIIQTYNKYVLESGNGSVPKPSDQQAKGHHRRNAREIYKLDRISESVHENSSSSSTSKNEQNNKCNNNGKVCDETLRDAENISDIDEADMDEWYENEQKPSSPSDVVIYSNGSEGQKNASGSSGNGGVGARGGTVLRRNSADGGAQRRNSNQDNNEDSPKPVTTLAEKTSHKTPSYRCDAIVMYDSVNNINFCKLCKLYAYDPPSKLERGKSISVQVNENDFDNQVEEAKAKKVVKREQSGKFEKDKRSRESIKFKDFDFEHESDISEIKMNFQYDINDSFTSQTFINASKAAKYDEDVVKQRTRDGLRFWQDEDKKHQQSQQEPGGSRRASLINEASNGDVRNKISVFESIPQLKSNTSKPILKKSGQFSTQTSEEKKTAAESQAKSEINRQIQQLGAAQRNVNVYRVDSKNPQSHVNVLFTDLEDQMKSMEKAAAAVMDESDVEEVEIVINIGNLPKFPAAIFKNQHHEDNPYSSPATTTAEIPSEINDNLKYMIMGIIPSSAGAAYVDEIVSDVKYIMRNEIFKLKTIDDLSPEMIEYIQTRYDDLLSGKSYNQDVSISSISELERNYPPQDPSNQEHTQVTVVKNIREKFDNNGGFYNDDDEVLKVDEETLYIVEKLRTNSDSSNSMEAKVHDVDKEVRKSFRLKSKKISSAAEGEEEAAPNLVSPNIGYTANDKFSAEALYDLNKQVVHRTEIQKLIEKYNTFRSVLIIMLDGLRKNEAALLQDSSAFSNNSDYQLHFLHLNDKKANKRNPAAFRHILMMSFDKNSTENFNSAKEIEHTHANILSLRRKHDARSNNVVARLNVVYIEDENRSSKKRTCNFSRFSLIDTDAIEQRRQEARPRHFVHVRYFKCPHYSNNNENESYMDKVTETRESLVDFDLLPQQIKLELLHQMEKYQLDMPNKKAFEGDIKIRYENDGLVLPCLTMLVLESDIIQNKINKKRDELISSTLAVHSDKLNNKVVELDNFIQSIEQELNSYLICEKVINRDTDQTDTRDLVKLNKLDALVSFETVQSFKLLFEKMKTFEVFIDSDDTGGLKKNANEFYIIDEGKYYKCLIPVEYISDKLREEQSEIKNLPEPLKQSSSLIIENMHKRQNYIFGKHLKSVFPLDQDEQRYVSDIRSIRLKQPKNRNKTAFIRNDKNYIKILDDLDPINNLSSESSDHSHSLTLTSSAKPDTKYHVKIDYEKKEVTKKEIETQYEYTPVKPSQPPPPPPVLIKLNVEAQTNAASQMRENGVQVDDEEQKREKKLIEELINENNLLKQQVSKSANVKKADVCVETEKEFEGIKDAKYTYDMVHDRSSYINDSNNSSSNFNTSGKATKVQPVQLNEMFGNEECPALEYEDMRNDMYLKFDEQDIESMQRKLIRDDIIINEIDKMFHTIRDHQGANEKAKLDHASRHRRSSSWGYSSDKRHVRAKVMEYESFAKDAGNRGSNNNSENIFLRIDDYLNPDVSRALVRSYSADYVNERTTLRTRIRYIRIPGEIIKTETITHYQYNIVPSEYRTVPYGLRYWSILKLLQEERESGQPYVYLGDTYLGQPPEEWLNAPSVVKDIVKNGGVIDPNVIIANKGELYAKSFHLDNNEIETFMSTSNLEKEIQLVKTNEDLIRKISDCLHVDLKPQTHNLSNFMSPLILSEKTTNYEKQPDKIIPTIERIDDATSRRYEDMYHQQQQHQQQQQYGKPPIYNKFVNYNAANGYQGSKKYPLLDDVVNEAMISKNNVPSSKRIEDRLLANRIENATNKSTSVYGHYYSEVGSVNLTNADSRPFVDLEEIISKKIDDTKNYLRALSADNLLNEAAIKQQQHRYQQQQAQQQVPEFQPNLKNPRSFMLNSKSLKDLSTIERTLSIPNYGTYHYAPAEPEYLYYEADASQIPGILNGNYEVPHNAASFNAHHTNGPYGMKMDIRENLIVYNQQLMDPQNASNVYLNNFNHYGQQQANLINRPVEFNPKNIYN